MSEPLLPFIPVVLESPYAGEIVINVEYARAALRDCLLRGEAPFASHLLYTQVGVLFDGDPAERARGILAGFAWRQYAAYTVFYINLGWSEGMLAARHHCLERVLPYTTRRLAGWA